MKVKIIFSIFLLINILFGLCQPSKTINKSFAKRAIQEQKETPSNSKIELDFNSNYRKKERCKNIFNSNFFET